MGDKLRVLFLCVHNSARSQMAEGLLNHFYGDRYQAFSAGSEPQPIQPLAVWVMAELGIDISRQRSKSLKELYGQYFDLVISTCEPARSACPIFPCDAEKLHWNLPDPARAEGSKKAKMAVYRQVRDELMKLIREMVEKGG
jgi:arsenate reductase